MENKAVANTATATVVAPKPEQTVKAFFDRLDVKTKFQDMLGKNSAAFLSSVLQIIQTDDKLRTADTLSLYNAALVAATLNLSINPNFGFSAIVPFNNRQKDGSYKVVAQFTMMYKGLIQLCQRTGQYKTINVTDVREGEIGNFNRLTGEIEWKWIQDTAVRETTKIIGYVAYFELKSGFSKLLYMDVNELEVHGKKYSKSYKGNYGLWFDNFDAMAKKTVLKLLLSKYAPVSVEIQTATAADQAVIKNVDGNTIDVEYSDNSEPVKTDPEAERVTLLIGDAESKEQLEKYKPHCNTEGLMEIYNNKLKMLEILPVMKNESDGSTSTGGDGGGLFQGEQQAKKGTKGK